MRWTVRAHEHVVEIAAFIENSSRFQAQRVVQLIVSETRRLNNNPRIGKMVPEVRDDRYRELRVFSFRILYKIIDDDLVVVLGVVHGRRVLDPDWLL